MGIFREFRYELSALFFVLGILGMVFSLIQYLASTQSPDWLKSIHHAVGEDVARETLAASGAVRGAGALTRRRSARTADGCSLTQADRGPRRGAFRGDRRLAGGRGRGAQGARVRAGRRSRAGSEAIRMRRGRACDPPAPPLG